MASDLIRSILYIVISCLVIWRSSHGFEVASDFLGRKLPPGIKGATINAIASSMPEFLTTVFFLFYLRDAEGFGAGLGVSSGSALFNLLIIPALAVIMLYTINKKTRVVLDRRVLLREGLVLVLSQVVFIIILYKGTLKGQHGLILVLIYLAYLSLLYLITKRKRKGHSDYRHPDPGIRHPLWRNILSLNLDSLVLKGRKINTRNAWILLVISTLVMTAGTWLLVHGTDLFGSATDTHLIFVAVVLSAAATSVPDTIISLKDARKGNYDDAVSNALGSNIFDIAFALGLPILLFNLIKPGELVIRADIQEITQEVWVFLLLATVLSLAIMLIGKTFGKKKAIVLLLIYAIFLFYVGTQIEGMLEIETLQSIGDPIETFLNNLAQWLGERIN